MKKIIKSQIKSFIIVSLILITGAIFITILHNQIIKIRLLEFDSKLQIINRQESNRDYINLVMKYRTMKDLYNGKITENDLSIKEIESAYLTNNLEENNLSQRRTSKLVLFLINGIRFLLGKPPITLKESIKYNQYIELAYYYERNKYYQRALDIYQKALDEENGYTDNTSIILLHQGFCYSLLDQYGKARKKFLEVINTYSDKKISLTAFLLLQFIDDFNNELKLLNQTSESPFKNSQKLYHLLSYKKAIGILDQLEKKESNKKNIPYINYYKARCLEETGELKSAISIYQQNIFDYPGNTFSNLSNKRLYTIGIISNLKNELFELSSINNKINNDPTFDVFQEKSIKLKVEQDEFLKKYKLFDENFNTHNTEEDVEMKNLINNLIKKSKENTKNPNIPKKQAPLEKIESKTRKYRNEFVNTFNNKGQIIKSTFYNDKSLMEYYNVLEYNKNGDVIKMLQFNNSNNLMKYFVYEYDKNGKALSIKTYDANGNIIEQ